MLTEIKGAPEVSIGKKQNNFPYTKPLALDSKKLVGLEEESKSQQCPRLGQQPEDCPILLAWSLIFWI